MADFSLWVSACEEKLPWAEGDFLRAYNANRESTRTLALEADPLADVVVTFAKRLGEVWVGTATQLLAELTTHGGLDNIGWKCRRLPIRPNVLTNNLRRLAPDLRSIGIDVELTRKNNRRIIRISPKNTVTIVTSSPIADSGSKTPISSDDEGDDAIRGSSPHRHPKNDPGAIKNANRDDGDDGDDDLRPLSCDVPEGHLFDNTPIVTP